jgi:hypothetical protein
MPVTMRHNLPDTRRGRYPVPLALLAAILLPAVLFNRPPAAAQSGPNRVLYRLLPDLPVVDVRTFKAKGDGVTNDATSFANAIAALPATGGTIFIPASANRYVINSAVSVNKPVTFVGTAGTVLEVGTGGFTVNASNVIWRDVEFYGNTTVVVRGLTCSVLPCLWPCGAMRLPHARTQRQGAGFHDFDARSPRWGLLGRETCGAGPAPAAV